MARAEGPRPEVLCRRTLFVGHGREAFESQWHRNKHSSGHRRRDTVPEGAGQGWGPAVSSEGGSGAGGVLTAVPSTVGAVGAAGAGAASSIAARLAGMKERRARRERPAGDALENVRRVDVTKRAEVPATVEQRARVKRDFKRFMARPVDGFLSATARMDAHQRTWPSSQTVCDFFSWRMSWRSRKSWSCPERKGAGDNYCRTIQMYLQNGCFGSM